MSTITGTGKIGICVSGNLNSPHLSAECNGINFVIHPNDAPLLPALFKHLSFIGQPVVQVVELLENEELFDIKGILKTIATRKNENRISKKAVRTESLTD